MLRTACYEVGDLWICWFVSSLVLFSSLVLRCSDILLLDTAKYVFLKLLAFSTSVSLTEFVSKIIWWDMQKYWHCVLRFLNQTVEICLLPWALCIIRYPVLFFQQQPYFIDKAGPATSSADPQSFDFILLLNVPSLEGLMVREGAVGSREDGLGVCGEISVGFDFIWGMGLDLFKEKESTSPACTNTCF